MATTPIPEGRSSRHDLRAFVRYDGSGRIIPGSLILRRTMPKVGDWVEGPISLCCTTTTSTTIRIL